MTDVTTATSPTTENSTDTTTTKPEMSDLDRIKAAHAARRSRRTQAKPQTTETSAETVLKEENKDEDPKIAQLKKDYETQIAKLKEESVGLRVEIKSLNRLRADELKELSDQRDMFAMQLAKEQQSKPKTGSTDNSKTVDSLTVQLKAARVRNNDLEDENKRLRDEVKQLNFMVQANKTLTAASEGYEDIVQELVTHKLKCAQLSEEKESLMHMNNDLSVTSQVLRDANGELETSRSDWVVKCADLEREKGELQRKLRLKAEDKPANPSDDTSYAGSDLQELKLN